MKKTNILFNRIAALWEVLTSEDFVLIKLNRTVEGTDISYRVKSDSDSTLELAEAIDKVRSDIYVNIDEIN